ncbi:MAG: rod shape-determining protein MreC [Candidatus Komeilibacteria bacterium]|nr:rod shape-determining protein MreC [Candidatus Komeilibacteria bacterium]
MTKNKRNRLVTVVVVAILLIFFHYAGITGWLGQRLTPLGGTTYRWGKALAGFFNYQELVKENGLLKEEAAKLSIDYLKLAAISAENDYLKKELAFVSTSRYQYQLANVVGRLPLNEQILIIDQGSSAGLAVGQPVTVNQGVIVGRLIKVEETRSSLQLLTDTNSQLAVTAGDFKGTNGLLKGQAGNSLLLDLIPQDQELKIDDLVITSGLEEKIPRGLLVGRISQINQLVGQIFKQARVNPLFNYQNLQIVDVIK